MSGSILKITNQRERTNCRIVVKDHDDAFFSLNSHHDWTCLERSARSTAVFFSKVFSAASSILEDEADEFHWER